MDRSARDRAAGRAGRIRLLDSCRAPPAGGRPGKCPILVRTLRQEAEKRCFSRNRIARDPFRAERLKEMATKLEKPLKREVMIGDQAYMLTISPEGLKLVVKGKRNGLELGWKALVSGETALATALNASLGDGSPKQ